MLVRLYTYSITTTPTYSALQQKLYGEGSDNPVEFSAECERNMELVSTHTSNREKIGWIARCLTGSVRLWYSIIRDKTSDYKQFLSNRDIGMTMFTKKLEMN